jgi:hypothetical protein
VNVARPPRVIPGMKPDTPDMTAIRQPCRHCGRGRVSGQADRWPTGSLAGVPGAATAYWANDPLISRSAERPECKEETHRGGAGEWTRYPNYP